METGMGSGRGWGRVGVGVGSVRAVPRHSPGSLALEAEAQRCRDRSALPAPLVPGSGGRLSAAGGAAAAGGEGAVMRVPRLPPGRRPSRRVRPPALGEGTLGSPGGALLEGEVEEERATTGVRTYVPVPRTPPPPVEKKKKKRKARV